jgi:hypothetical protein
MLLVCPNRSLPVSRDRINSHTSSNGHLAKTVTAKTVPRIKPRVFRILRQGNLAYRFGTPAMGNKALAAQPVISSDSRASRRLTASGRESPLRTKDFSMSIDIKPKLGHGCRSDKRECSTRNTVGYTGKPLRWLTYHRNFGRLSH